MNTLKISPIKFVIQPSEMLNNILSKGRLNQINKFIKFLNKKFLFLFLFLFFFLLMTAMLFHICSYGKASACNVGDPGSIPGSGRYPGEGNGLSTPLLLPGKFHGLRSLVGYNPWGCKESDMTEQLHFLSFISNYKIKLPIFFTIVI